jgi:hypothetical protein
MPQSAENVIAAIEQRRIAAMMAADINTLDELIDEQCTHIGVCSGCVFMSDPT